MLALACDGHMGAAALTLAAFCPCTVAMAAGRAGFLSFLRTVAGEVCEQRRARYRGTTKEVQLVLDLMADLDVHLLKAAGKYEHDPPPLLSILLEVLVEAGLCTALLVSALACGDARVPQRMCYTAEYMAPEAASPGGASPAAAAAADGDAAASGASAAGCGGVDGMVVDRKSVV